MTLQNLVKAGLASLAFSATALSTPLGYARLPTEYESSSAGTSSGGYNGRYSRKYREKGGTRADPVYRKQSLSNDSERDDDKNLQGKIDLYIKALRQDRYLARTDQTSIMVYDLADDKTLVSINAEQPRMAASLIKPFVMLAVYEADEQNRLQAKCCTYGFVERMITYHRGVAEANRSTNILLREVGIEYANNVFKKQGFRQTRIQQLIPRDGRTYLNTTSAQDLTTLFTRLYKKQLLGRRGDAEGKYADEEMLNLLTAGHPSRLRTPAMNGVKIANKTGYVYGLNGDAGIVFMKDQQGKERPYVIAVMIEDKTKPFSKQREGVWGKKRTKIIREVSGMVYEGMRKRG